MQAVNTLPSQTLSEKKSDYFFNLSSAYMIHYRLSVRVALSDFDNTAVLNEPGAHEELAKPTVSMVFQAQIQLYTV